MGNSQISLLGLRSVAEHPQREAERCADFIDSMAVRERVTQSDVKTEVVSDPPNETDQSGYRVELTEADGSTNLLMNTGHLRAGKLCARRRLVVL